MYVAEQFHGSGISKMSVRLQQGWVLAELPGYLTGLKDLNVDQPEVPDGSALVKPLLLNSTTRNGVIATNGR